MGSWEKLSLSESEGSKFATRDDQETEGQVLFFFSKLDSCV